MPSDLAKKNIRLIPVGNDVEAILEDRPVIHAAPFPKMNTLADLPGKRIGLIGIGGGSDVVQAAQLGQLIKRQGKEVPFVISIRSAKPTSQGVTNTIAASRTVENPEETVTDGVYRIGVNTRGSGRFLENIPADRIPVYLVVDHEDGTLSHRIQAAVRHAGGASTIVAVDTGGDALYRNQVTEGAKATPDQDLRVLHTLASLPEANIMTAEIAAGIDSPSDAQQILLGAKARFYEPTVEEANSVLAAYRNWQMDGTDDQRFGKTSLAWQMALQGQTGLQTLPLPARVVTDPINPWNPFVHVDPSMRGIFFMNLRDHLGAIGSRP